VTFLDRFKAKPEKGADVRAAVGEYLDQHLERLMSTWLSMGAEEDMFGGLDRREIVRRDTINIADTIAAHLREQKIKVPDNLLTIVREELNERIFQAARPYIVEFVARYRHPRDEWPREVDIPLKDMQALEKTLEEHQVALGLLYYDINDDKLRGLLEKYGVRKRPKHQDAEVWARSFSYMHEDIIALKARLREKGVRVQAVEHLLGDLRIMVKDELLAEQDEQFERSFKLANPWLIATPTRDGWIRAYVATFGRNLDYLPYLQRMAARRGTYFEKEELKALVEEALRQQG
jgi:hypothetical protein